MLDPRCENDEPGRRDRGRRQDGGPAPPAGKPRHGAVLPGHYCEHQRIADRDVELHSIQWHRGWSTKPQGLDILWALAFRVRGRKILEAVDFASDQHAADQFFWKNYELAPLPDRLA
ncbi:hypothetical protein DMH04_30305 [Kibdelosporangium aridum]|uniref:Uncharacterized protein n=1 Tax=Kibdelosporangium aridum TaxID=2030 RepID=A0A428Z375_KIBAR|nr:hypothetical protein DMH04_30305 [Kibdelosporangium aridum]